MAVPQDNLERENQRVHQVAMRRSRPQPGVMVNPPYGGAFHSSGGLPSPPGSPGLGSSRQHPGMLRRSWSAGDHRAVSAPPIRPGFNNTVASVPGMGVPPAMPSAMPAMPAMFAPPRTGGPMNMSAPNLGSGIPQVTGGMLTGQGPMHGQVGRAMPLYRDKDPNDDGSHFPHSEAEVQEQKGLLHKALSNKMHAFDAGPLSTQTDYISDTMLENRVGDLNALEKEERKALGIPENDYQAKRAHLEREVRSRMEHAIRTRKLDGTQGHEMDLMGIYGPTGTSADGRGMDGSMQPLPGVTPLGPSLEDEMPTLSRQHARTWGWELFTEVASWWQGV